MSFTTPSSGCVRDGASPIVVAVEGRFDAEAEAAFEASMLDLQRAPRDAVFDVSRVEHLDVRGILLLADHAQWLRRRSCTVKLVGARPESEQLARLLGYERALGLD